MLSTVVNFIVVFLIFSLLHGVYDFMKWRIKKVFKKEKEVVVNNSHYSVYGSCCEKEEKGN